MLSPAVLRCGRFTIDLSRPRVMAIVNVTPDSFAGGRRAADASAAVNAAQAAIADGADIVDVGAESTRPGAVPVGPADEWARLAPVLRDLRDAQAPVSVDTRHPETMRRALDAGASMINDVGGFVLAAARGALAGSDAALCVMHMQGEPATMQHDPRYEDVVNEVGCFLGERVEALVAAGVATERIVLDPGFGFGKALDHNLALLRGLSAIVAIGPPVLVGLSRKGTIGALTGRPVDERLAGSLAAALAAIARGAAIVRVHDVAETVDALAVWTAARQTGRAADQRGPGGR